MKEADRKVEVKLQSVDGCSPLFGWHISLFRWKQEVEKVKTDFILILTKHFLFSYKRPFILFSKKGFISTSCFHSWHRTALALWLEYYSSPPLFDMQWLPNGPLRASGWRHTPLELNLQQWSPWGAHRCDSLLTQSKHSPGPGAPFVCLRLLAVFATGSEKSQLIPDQGLVLG